MDEYRWASAVGRVRALERTLFGRATLIRLLELPGAGEVANGLRDTVYGPYLAQAKGPEEYDVALEAALRDFYLYVLGFAPEPEVILAYLARYDFHNLKVLAKAEAMGQGPERKALSRLGWLTLDELRAAMREAWQAQEERAIPNEELRVRSLLLDAISRACSELPAATATGTGSPAWAFLLDGIVDKAYYSWYGGVLSQFGYERLLEFAQAEADLVNLKDGLRAMRYGIPSDLYQRIVLPGGNVKPPVLVDAYSKGPRAFADAYAETGRAGLARKGASLVEQGASLTSWEKECDDALTALIARARLDSLGPGPVLGYLYARELEVKNLRILFAGKDALLPGSEISERLREMYV